MDKKAINFRNALKVLALTKLNYRIDEGEFDNLIETFLDGDSLGINLKFELIPNDIIIMNCLAGGKIDNKIMKKVTNLWKKK